jgi:hypothetical protein
MPENSALIQDLIVEIKQLKTKVTELEQCQTNQPATVPTAQTTSRRKLLKRMAIVAVGASAATTALATTTGNANASAVGTVAGASTNFYGITSAPNGVTPFTPNVGAFGLIGLADSIINQPTLTNAGVLGHSHNSAGIFGNSHNGTGIVGKSHNGVAISGQSVNGDGISGIANSSNSTGVKGQGGNIGVSGISNNIGGYFSGGKVTILLEPTTRIGIPTTDNHRRGELVASSENGDATNLYFCIQGNNSNVGTWVRLNQSYVAGNNIAISPRNTDGTFTISATGTAAGVSSVNGQSGAITLPPNITLLATPVRVAATVAPFNALPLRSTGATPAVGNSSTVQLTIAGTNGIPAGAKGVVGVLTNVGATSGGNLRFWTSGTAPNVANLNIPGAMPSLNLTASFAIPLDLIGKTYLGYGTGAVGATCGYVVDISGFWL